MKTYTGIELLQAINNGDIKDKTEFWFSCNIGQGRYKFCRNDGSFFDSNNGNRNIMADYDLLEIANGTFELLEKNQDIDIQSIKEWETKDTINDLHDVENEIRFLWMGYNNLLKIAKQLDRQINNN